MNYTAKWGPMGFMVSPSKIIPFTGLTTSVSLKNDTGTDTSGTAPTNTRGLELQSIDFSTTYMRAAGVDPLEKYNEWVALIGETNTLYIGGKRFGLSKMMLKQVDISASELSASGEFLSISIKIKLQEDPDASASDTLSPSASRAAATYAATVAKKEALNATASPSDRAERSPNISRVGVSF